MANNKLLVNERKADLGQFMVGRLLLSESLLKELGTSQEKMTQTDEQLHNGSDFYDQLGQISYQYLDLQPKNDPK